MIAWASFLLWPAICHNITNKQRLVNQRFLVAIKLSYEKEDGEFAYHEHFLVLEIQFLYIMNASLHGILEVYTGR